jgi:hypothetical protein
MGTNNIFDFCMIPIARNKPQVSYGVSVTEFLLGFAFPFGVLILFSRVLQECV